jgi:hypothetical protein
MISVRNPAWPPTAVVATGLPLDRRLKTEVCAISLYHFTSGKQIQDAADRLREEHLPVFDRYGIVEYDRDEDRVRATKSTMLFDAAIDEIEDAVATDETSGTISADYAEEAAKAWLSTATQEFS